MVAGVVGTIGPVLPAALNLDSALVATLGLLDAYSAGSIVLSSFWLALVQLVVLGLLQATSLTRILAWIPVSVGATLFAYAFLFVWQVTVPRSLISVSAIQASLPPDFPLLQIIFALFGIVVAAFVGVAQGVFLARLWESKSVAYVWIVANVTAAVAVGIVSGLRLQEPVPADDATVTQMFLTNQLIQGGLYAAITGAALVAVSSSYLKRRRAPLSV